MQFCNIEFNIYEILTKIKCLNKTIINDLNFVEQK